MSADMFSEAVQALKNGQRLRAKDLLTRLIKADATNPDYWLWMSASVDSEKEQVFCLQNVLKLDPNSIPARRGLVVLGALRPEESGLPPASVLEDMPVVLPEFSASGRLAGTLARRRNLERLALLAAGALGLVVFTTVCLALFKLGPFAVRPNTVVVTSTVPPSSTPAPTITPSPVPAGACEIPAEPNPATPLAVYLCLQQTPTPLPIPTDAFSPSEDYGSMKRAYERQDWNDILRVANVVVNDQELSTRALVYFYLGEAYRHTANQPEAIRQYGLALSLDGAFAPAFWGRARSQIVQNRRNDALADFGRALAANPAFVPALLDRAAYQLALGDVTAAVADLEQARQAAPANAEAQASLALAYLQSGQLDEAAEAAEGALAKDPALALGYFARGSVAYAQGDYDAAQADLSRSYRYVLDRDVPLANQWQAGVLLVVAQSALAAISDAHPLPLLDQAIELYDGNPALFLARGDLYLNDNDFENARADYSAAITLLERAPANTRAGLPAAYVGLGQALLGLERPDTAQSAFQSALRLEPANFAANLGLGQSLLGNDRAEDAVAALTTALDLAATTAERLQVYVWRAQAYAATGETEAEVADLQAITELSRTGDELVPTAQARLTEIGPLPTGTATITATATNTAPATTTATVTTTATATTRATATRTP